MNQNTQLIIPASNPKYHLLKDADVQVTKRLNTKNKRPEAIITVNGEFTHEFSHKSRVSKHLDMMEPKMLAERLSGGTYFFLEDEGIPHLIDFKDGSYNGFVHNTDTIDAFMDTIGFERKKDLKQLVHRQKRGSDDEIDSPLILRAEWHKNKIEVPYYSGGADFNSVLSFRWSPFEKAIKSSFDLVRLVCTNGMVGVTSFLNNKVPLFNRWEDHLDIAATQIQNKVDSVVRQRIGIMTETPASIGDLLLLEEHAAIRYNATEDGAQRRRLMSIMHASSPSVHLGSVYRPQVFEDKQVAAQLPGHLSVFDAFNLATELATHTEQTGKSSDFALYKFANGKLFNDDDGYVHTGSLKDRSTLASFSDPTRAYFGDLIVA